MAMIACASCARLVPAGARFCPSCGAPASASGFAPEERRFVTVLFADLVGFTTLAERLDPERVKRLIESCFERLVIDVETFGGRVDKVLGDAIVALFGAPVAHEDDAERAVRAALRMQHTLRAFGSGRASDDPANEIAMRVGINTGEVLVGTLAGSDYTAMGDVVNTAARLQSLAPPGGVLIGDATASLCPASIDRQRFGPTAIRGRQQEEEAWLVTGATRTAARPVRCDIPFVGRIDEQALLAAVVNLVGAGRSAVISVIGEPGAGKSRLADEIVTALKPDAIVIESASAPFGESSLWAPMRGGFSTLLGLEPEPTAADIRGAIERESAHLWSLSAGDEALESLIDVALHLFGLQSGLERLDAAAANDRITAVITDMVRRHAQTRLTVLWVDNLQWADPIVRDLLAVLVRSLADLPFLLLTTQRPDDEPEGHTVWPPAHLDRPLVVRVPLAPLGRSDAETLVRSVAARGATAISLDDDAVADLVERGGGNPLFLIELTSLAASCPAEAELPGSLRALIAARLDRLPTSRRAIIDNAAVLGLSGSVPALNEFADAMGQDFLGADVDELAADGLVDIDGAWWRFRSDVVREVAYQTLTKRVRAQRHAGVAAALAAEEHLLEDFAHHAATAAELVAELGPVDYVPATITTQAVTALVSAAAEAAEAGRSAHAIRHATRALDLSDDDITARRRLLLTRASARVDLRQFPAAEADARQALELALGAEDHADEADARRQLGTAAHMQGNLATARVELDLAVGLARAIEDPKRLADSVRARGFAELFGGSLPVARSFLDDALTMFQDLGDERGDAWARHNLAWAAFLGGDFATAETLLTRASDQFSRLGDRVGVNWAEGLRAYVTYFQRRFDEAEQLAMAVIADAKRWDDGWALMMMQTLLANMRLWTGHLAEAEQLAERALTGFRESGDRYGVMNSLAPLNRARAALGQDTEARRGAEELIALGHSFGELGLAIQGASAVAMHLGDGEGALVLAEQVLERARSVGAADGEATVLRALALSQLGRPDDALAAIEGLGDERVVDFPFGLAARALVRALSGQSAAALADADRVEHVVGASYFDIALARLAATVAAAHSGRPDDAEAHVLALTRTAREAGDVVFIATARSLTSRLANSADGGPALRPGWRRIVESVG